jgi:hypothetical protein
MPTWAKIILAVVGVIIALFIAAGFIGYNWVMKNKGQFVAVRGEGVEFGKGKTAAQCIDAAVARLGSGAMMSGVSARIFVGGCLTTASATEALCATVPPRTEIMRSAQWSFEQCRTRGANDQQGCTQIFQAVVEHCQHQAR